MQKFTNIFPFGQKLTTVFQKLTVVFLVSLPCLLYAQERITLGLTGVTLKQDIATLVNFQNYLASKIGVDINIQFAKSYSVMESGISGETIDLAYVCGSTYINIEHNKAGELLVIPVVDNKTTYSSYIITKKAAPYKSLIELGGTIFAMSDPDSNSGSLVPIYELLKSGYSKETFFKKIVFTYDHGESIQAVLSGFVDAASVDSMVYNAFMRKNREIKDELKIIGIFEGYPIPPFVIRKNFPKHLKESLQKAFLEMDENDEGRLILEKMAIDKFIKPDNISYEKIETIKNYISKHQNSAQ